MTPCRDDKWDGVTAESARLQVVALRKKIRAVYKHFTDKPGLSSVCPTALVFANSTGLHVRATLGKLVG